jgi:hypothetical protein
VLVNVAVGSLALDANTTASIITQQLDINSLGANTTGSQNTANGNRCSLNANTTGANNVAKGSLGNNTAVVLIALVTQQVLEMYL